MSNPNPKVVYTLSKYGQVFQRFFKPEQLLEQLEHLVETATSSVNDDKQKTVKLEVTVQGVTVGYMLEQVSQNLEEWFQRDPKEFKDWAIQAENKRLLQAHTDPAVRKELESIYLEG